MAEIGLHLVHDLLGLVKLCCIAGIAFHLYTKSSNFLLGSLAVLVDHEVGEGDVGALAGKFQCDSLANAACSTGDQGNFSFK